MRFISSLVADPRQCLWLDSICSIRRVRSLPHVYTANEFVYDTPKRLNENSVVISCSHSGNTPETVEATKLARSKGALTICLSNLEGSPLWEAAEYPVHYDWGKEVSDSDKNRVSFTAYFSAFFPYSLQMRSGMYA